tara:strand:- start:35084 stop:35335 length:252 start_codon:yes stop_codon:yes gene_type:complete
MKVKIKEIDPTGTILNEKEFTLPLVKKPKVEYRTTTIDGIDVPMRYEPMRKVRYLLEINDYKYWFRSNGELDPHHNNPEDFNK